jgi:hypothetical protein
MTVGSRTFERSMSSLARRVSGVILLATVALLAGAAITKNPTIAIGLVGLSAVAGIYMFVEQRVSSPAVVWMPLCWVVFMFASDQKFTQRNPLAGAAGSVSTENIVELAAYGLFTVLALGVLTISSGSLAMRRVSVSPIYFLFPSVALVSVIWSIVPLFTVVRALQLFCPLLVAGAMATVWLSDSEAGETIWRRSLRILVDACVLVSLIGFARFHGGRFVWPGAKPDFSSEIDGLALLLLLTEGRTLLRLRTTPWVCRAVVLGAAMAFGQTRAALIAVAVGVVLHLWISGRVRVSLRLLVLPAVVLGAASAYALAQAPITAYIQRGQNAATFTSLSQRTMLWQIAVNYLHTPQDWILGFGYGSPRVLLFTLVDWAGNAHSAYVEALLATGIVGLAAMCIILVSVGMRLFRCLRTRQPFSRSAAMMFVYVVVISSTNVAFAQPGMDYTALCLVIGYLTAVQAGALLYSPLRRTVSESEPDLALW